MTSKRSQPASTQDPSGFELENFLPYRLSVLTNTVSQGIARSYRDRHDITVTEWRFWGVMPVSQRAKSSNAPRWTR